MSDKSIEQSLVEALGDKDTLISHMKRMILDLEGEVATLKAENLVSTQPEEER